MGQPNLEQYHRPAHLGRMASMGWHLLGVVCLIVGGVFQAFLLQQNTTSSILVLANRQYWFGGGVHDGTSSPTPFVITEYLK